ncbi:MAG: ABC transporter substrate-binding protein [Gammaproteobacteria bacterium]
MKRYRGAAATRRAGLTAALALLSLAMPYPAAAGPSGKPAISPGEQMYRSGILPSGRLMAATVEHDVPVTANQLACAQCHRRSGLGSSEGGTVFPPINGRALFAPKQSRRAELGGVRTPGQAQRPAYTRASLIRAIRDGIDPSGRELNRLMPRYALNPADVEKLVDYLATLSTEPSPGVTDSELHLATIIAPPVDAAKKQAMLAVLRAYVRDKNAQTRLESRRKRHSPWHKEWPYEAYRTWVLHVWELKGPPDSWSAQMEAHYRTWPVFAVVGGLGAGQWQPVHAFCEQRAVPCLFPNVALPPDPGKDFYTVYFTRGLYGDAAAVARHLADSTARHIVQLYPDTENGRVLAAAFDDALKKAGLGPSEGHPLAKTRRPDKAYWKEILRTGAPDALVVWLPASQVSALASLPPSLLPGRLYLSSGTLEPQGAAALPASLRERTFLAQRFVREQSLQRRLRRVNAWLRAKHIPITAPRIQANTFFAVTTVTDVMSHIRGNFYRDYFLEKVEHMVDNVVWKSVYPDMSLAPGQRTAVKGCYIVSLADGRATWLVP